MMGDVIKDGKNLESYLILENKGVTIQERKLFREGNYSGEEYY